MHLQANSLFDFGAKVTRKVVQLPIHHVVYAPSQYEVATSRCIYKKCDRCTGMDGQTDDGLTLVQN